MLYRRTLRPEMLPHLFRGQLGVSNAWDSKQELGHVTSCLDVGKRCAAESSVGACAAAAELPLERCCIDALCAQEWWRVCFGGKLGA